MSSVKRPVRIPQDLRDTVTALQINLTGLVQQYTDSFRFYPYFSTRTEQEKSGILSRIRHGFVEFQRGSNIYFDPVLLEINQRYGKLLIELSNNKKLTQTAHDDQSAILIGNWEKEVRPLINYPEELTLSEGGRICLHFNFVLCHINYNHNIRRLLYLNMQRISLAYLYAYDYPGNPFNNDMVKDFFEAMRRDGKVFMPRTAAQAAVIIEYEKKLGDLYRELVPVKNYTKRLKAFKMLVREWAGKVEGVQQKIELYPDNKDMDWFDDLDKNQQNDVTEGLNELDSGHFFSHDEAKKSWL